MGTVREMTSGAAVVPRPEMPIFDSIPLDNLRESETNPRRRFNEESLQELAESVRAHGVLVPLLVRRKPNGRTVYELIAGERRYRAAKLAGLAEAPVRLCEMTDAQVLEVQLVENLQREDVHPLDEALGYQALIEKAGYDVPLLATKLGKSETYVYQRLKLLDLIEPLREDFLAGSIGFGHALLLARLQPDDQKRIEKDWLFDGRHQGHAVSVAELRDYIERSIYLDLHAAPWKKDDAELLPKAGACVDCAKRSGFRPALFPELAKKDTCLDRKCYTAKGEAFALVQVKAVETETGSCIRISTKYEYDRKRRLKGVLYEHDYHLVGSKEKRCDNTKAAVVVQVDEFRKREVQLGQKVQVCTASRCGVHRPSYSAPAPTAEQKRRDLEIKRDAEIDDLVHERGVAAVVERSREVFDLEDLRLVASAYWGRLWHERQKMILRRRGIKLGDKDSVESALETRIAEMDQQELSGLLIEMAVCSGFEEDEMFESVAARKGVDLEALRKAATAEVNPKYKAKFEALNEKKPAAKKAAGGNKR